MLTEISGKFLLCVVKVQSLEAAKAQSINKPDPGFAQSRKVGFFEPLGPRAGAR